MASRPTARASRAAIRQVRTPLESIWITDSVLASAFERYCNTSRPPRRKSSSVPGPLENRRRLGMRRMTGLYSTEFQPTLPPWMLESPVDLSQWTWSPPTPPETRMKNMAARETAPPVTSGFWKLLAPTPKPVKAQATQPTLEDEVFQAADNKYQSILEKASEALFRSLPQEKLGYEYTNAMDSLRKDIYLGMIPAAEIPDILAGFTQRLDQLLEHTRRDWTDNLPCGREQTFQLARLQFVDAILRGLFTSRVQCLEQLEPATCNALLTMLSETAQSREAISLFQLFMQTAPESYANQVSSGIQTYLRTWLTDSKKPPKHLAASLVSGRLDIKEGTRLFDAVAALVTKMCEGQKRGEVLRAQTAWLVLLAHSPHVRTSYFVDALERYTTLADNWSLSRERQVCELLLRHWRSRKWVKHWVRPDVHSVGHLLCNVVYSIESTGQRKELLLMVMRITPREVLLRSITNYCDTTKSLCGRRLSWIARRSNDHRLALSLLDLAKVHRQKLKTSINPLQLALLPYLKYMVLDARVDVSQVWEAVSSLTEDDEKWLQLKKEVVRALSTWFSSAEHLGDRAMLRNISRCNAWMRSKGETPGPDNLLAITRASIRDLKRGEPGRFERHDWLIRLNVDCLGPEEGLKMAKVLGEWRSRNIAEHYRF